ncbi:hypothetical protein SEUCBS139899_009791 [Sporothrix eucalyptigena]|uniref:Secretory lipase n=1 Tax=Sporothrix eucalyptigena TaxID=1812306 RepID=A0ABP0CYL7_9PEZI
MVASSARGLLAAGLAAVGFSVNTRSSDEASCTAPYALGPDGLDFYTPPSTLPDGDHGSLIWYRPYDNGSATMTGGANTLLLYTQVGIHGNTVATSGYMVVPDGDAPDGGWPVVTFAHGTTGIADQCAPTIDDPSYDEDTKTVLLESWIKKGYAVVRTDYEGLGTPGDHPYLIGPSEGRAVLDIVRAARQFEPSLGSRVVISGHSQGGHAALWAASMAAEYTPELEVLGTIAFAPANSLETEVPLLSAVGNITSLSGTVALIVRGLAIANASLDTTSIWTPDALQYYPETLTECSTFLDGNSSFGSVGANDLIASGANLTDILAQLKENDPTYITSIPQPVLVLQGSDDTTVYPFTTAAMVKNLKANGIDITEQIYDGATHLSIIDVAAANATAYLEATFNTLFNGEWVPNN